MTDKKYEVSEAILNKLSQFLDERWFIADETGDEYDDDDVIDLHKALLAEIEPQGFKR